MGRKPAIIIIISRCGCLLLLGVSSVAGQKGKIFPKKRKLEQKIIRLDSLTGTEIPAATINAGTTVIWINDLSAVMIEIMFTGQQVTLACKSPVHFIVDAKGTFTSDQITWGGVASLCFVEKETNNKKWRVHEDQKQ